MRGFLIRTLATRIILDRDHRSPLVGCLTLYMRIDPNILVLAATSLRPDVSFTLSPVRSRYSTFSARLPYMDPIPYAHRQLCHATK